MTRALPPATRTEKPTRKQYEPAWALNPSRDARVRRDPFAPHSYTGGVSVTHKTRPNSLLM
jgi:hypothetical protein